MYARFNLVTNYDIYHTFTSTVGQLRKLKHLNNVTRSNCLLIGVGGLIKKM